MLTHLKIFEQLLFRGRPFNLLPGLPTKFLVVTFCEKHYSKQLLFYTALKNISPFLDIHVNDQSTGLLVPLSWFQINPVSIWATFALHGLKIFVH